MGRHRQSRFTALGGVQARHAVEEVFQQLAPQGSRVRVGYARKLGDGASRQAFMSSVEVSPDELKLSGEWVALVPNPGEPRAIADRSECEVRLLAALATRALPFAVPRIVGAAPGEFGPVVICSFVAGFPLNFGHDSTGRLVPWEALAEIAAAIHSQETGGLEFVGGFEDRRAHAEAVIAGSFDDGEQTSELVAARAWAREHLPPATPSALLHGDLLGRNIYWDSYEERLSVIDWLCAARGDPAFDIAVVTDGVRAPFAKRLGIEPFLEHYHAHGGPGITASEVRLYELCVVAAAYRFEQERCLDLNRASGAPAQALQRLRNVLERVERER